LKAPESHLTAKNTQANADECSQTLRCVYKGTDCILETESKLYLHMISTDEDR